MPETIRIGADQARAKLTRLMKHVHSGGRVVIAPNGKPAVELVPGGYTAAVDAVFAAFQEHQNTEGLDSLHGALAQLERIRAGQTQAPLSPSLRRVLNLIEEHGPLTVRDVDEHLRVGYPAAYGALRRLVARGLVAVTSTDALNRKHDLTEAGKELCSLAPPPEGMKYELVKDEGGTD